MSDPLAQLLALRKIDWSFTAPVRIGDTLHVVAEVLEASPHPTESNRGRLSIQATYINQRGERVSRGHFTLVIRRRP